MPWYAGLTPLRDAFAELFPNATIAGVVVDDAEIDTSLLHLDGAPLVIWQNILSEAWKQAKVDALIAVAQQLYSTYAPLTAAIAHYRATPIPSLSGMPEPTSPSQPASIRQTATGHNIVQAGRGGSPTVNDYSQSTIFNQTDQTVFGSQTNIAGDVHITGSIFNTVTRTEDTLPAPVDLPSELRKLLTQVNRASQQGLLDEITAIDAESALKKAIALASKPTSDRQDIVAHLVAAQATINNAATQNIGGASSLTTAMANIIMRVLQSIT